MKTCLQPRGSLVLVRFDEEGEKITKEGIVIPKGSLSGKAPTSRFEEATVVAVGPGTWLECGRQVFTEDLRPGMRVLVKSGINMGLGVTAEAYAPVEEGGRRMGFVNQQEILAVIRPDDAGSVVPA